MDETAIKLTQCYGDQENVKSTSILMPNPGSAKETLLELYQLVHLLEDPQKYH